MEGFGRRDGCLEYEPGDAKVIESVEFIVFIEFVELRKFKDAG